MRAPEKPVRVALGLGGNIGDVAAAMAEALERLEQEGSLIVETVSGLYRTPPWGKTDQDWFTNACAVATTTLAPDALLGRCLEAERWLKRDRETAERWGPRTIDIDILLYGELESDDEDLVLPHPRMTERGFVLLPLAEIAPDWRVRDKNVAEWSHGAETTGIERVADGMWWRR